MSIYDDRTLAWFDRHGQPRPSHDPHGTEEDIRRNMKQLKPTNWYLEGNLLKGDTDWGPLVQQIPPDYIMERVDENGWPVFKKIDLTEA